MYYRLALIEEWKGEMVVRLHEVRSVNVDELFVIGRIDKISTFFSRNAASCSAQYRLYIDEKSITKDLVDGSFFLHSTSARFDVYTSIENARRPQSIVMAFKENGRYYKWSIFILFEQEYL